MCLLAVQDPRCKEWAFDFSNSLVMDRVKRYSEESTKKREKAYGRVYMENRYGGKDRLQEAIASGEVQIIEGDGGVELFQQTCYEILSKSGRRTLGAALRMKHCSHTHNKVYPRDTERERET